jgi:hypothetical protein
MERTAIAPHPVRGFVLAIAGVAVALVILVLGGVFDDEASAATRGTDDVCVAVDDSAGGTVLSCTHADEPPPGTAARSRSVRELIAEAGGPGVVARFTSTEPGAAIDVDRTGLGATAGPVDAGIDAPVGEATADGAEGGPLAPAATVPSTGTPGIPCWGSGSTGNRVQAVYAYTGTDRSAALIPLIRKWAAEVDITVRVSAAQSGGRRHVNWVHTSSCVLTVMKVKLSSKAAASFSRTITELAAKGLKRTDRRYLVWFDTNRYCGIGTAYRDDRAGKANRNNGRPYGPAAYSRVDRQCWGLHSTAYHSVEAHELMHNLGAVQYSAPHSTKAGHCFDEYDVMCYPDGGSRSKMKVQCTGKSNEAWLDCRKNDYFNVKPTAGTYLATHWNVARSSFLSATTTSDPILTAAGATPLAGSLADPTGDVRLAWTVVADAAIVSTALERSVDGGAFEPWIALSGSALATTQSLERGHTYRFRVTVHDAVGRRSFGRETPAVELERDLPPTVSTPTATIAYNAAATSVVDVEWWADDEDGWIVLAEVERSTDGTTWLPAWSGTSAYASITVPSGATYRFRVRARDSAGQWSAWSVSAPLIVPVGPVDEPPAITSPPVATVSHAAGTTTYVALSWDATDDRDVERSKVEVRADGGAWTVALADGQPTWAEVPVAQGHTYTFRVTVYDAIGQASAPALSDPLVVPLDLPPVITSGPTVTLQASTWNAQNPPLVSAAFAVTDETGIERVELWRGTSATGPWTVVTEWWDPDWGPITETVPPGATYWFRLVAVDVGGHTAARVTASGLAIAAQRLPTVSGPAAAITRPDPWVEGDWVEVTVSYASTLAAWVDVEMTADGGATWEFVGSGDETTAVVWVPSGATYRFRLVARSDEGLASTPATTANLVVPPSGP